MFELYSGESALQDFFYNKVENEIREVIRAESAELLQTFENLVLEIEASGAGDPDGESINALFRAVHTLKGTAGIADFKHVVDFAHVLESLLDEIRKGIVPIRGDIISALLTSQDHLNLLFDLEFNGHPMGEATRNTDQELRARIESFKGAGSTDESPSTGAAPVDGSRAESRNWHISLRFERDLFRHGLDPAPILAYLQQHGTIVNLITVTDSVPDLKDLDPEDCHLGFELQYDSQAPREQIEAAFEFVNDACSIRILGPGAELREFRDLIQSLPETDERAADLLLAAGALTATERKRIFASDDDADPGEGARASEGGPANQRARTSFLRIESARLDDLINLVGELAISAGALNQSVARIKDAETLEHASAINDLVGEARDRALQLRMVPVDSTFRKFRRFVRETGNALGKDIRLEVSGGETELDKSVAEKIEDPLTHIIRNAIDHGIETSPVRLEKNKPAHGTICVRAYHETGSIVIEIEDDGAGIDTEYVLTKGVEKGLLTPDAGTSEEDALALLFRPGFSTAGAVTDLSGRGVGLDVVKREIDALRGTVFIKSQLDHGTKFTIRLPLTLAIIDGFLVGVSDFACIIPLEQLVECLSITAADRVDRRRNCINLRGEVLPFIDLNDLFGVENCVSRKENIVVVQYGEFKAGLLVEELYGESQTVIKPLSKIFHYLRGISGMSVMGGGDIGFIMDVPALVQLASPKRSRIILI